MFQAPPSARVLTVELGQRLMLLYPNSSGRGASNDTNPTLEN
jgi:hypothetical protein